jgi:hypothetical protein
MHHKDITLQSHKLLFFPFYIDVRLKEFQIIDKDLNETYLHDYIISHRCLYIEFVTGNLKSLH